ncbi:unnamed protein product [Colletotrichum noveboracense]|uniref:Uncharacterized protein n=1 Tax=Colletotrichum noveboracense TaxID=2664923 RepID=A0A9W4S733_9PEZI|nr:unnamed protein product [Colletotrichum noveboracense]
MDKNGAKDVKSESQDEHKEKRDKPENGNHVQPSKSPKKRRKVNHVRLPFTRRTQLALASLAFAHGAETIVRLRCCCAMLRQPANPCLAYICAVPLREHQQHNNAKREKMADG